MKQLKVLNAFLPLVAVLILAGCNQPKPATTDGANNAPPANGGAPVDGNAGANTASSDEASRASIPQDLKHAAYEYYGLDNAEEVKMEITQDGTAYTGTQSTKLVEVKDGVATFRQDRTGGLETLLGSDEFTLEKDGIYAKSSSRGKILSRQLEMPADIAPGKTWTVNTDIELTPGGKATGKSTLTAERIETVKTKKGEYPDALLVVTKGELSSADSDGSMSTKQINAKAWYVKGRGAVKMELEASSKAGKTKIVVQEIP